MSRWRGRLSWLVVAVAATVVPSVMGAPSAGAEPVAPVCAATWNPTGGNHSELWVRCSTPAPATDVRVGFWWKNAWNMTFATSHAATARFDALATALEWKVGSVDFGSTKPFDSTNTPIDVMIDGRWQRATVTSVERTIPLVEPVLATDLVRPDPAPARLAAARCAVHWNPTSGNRSELWVRCATAARAADVRVGYWWKNAWDMGFATDHAATQRFETSSRALEWKVGGVDFGSNRPFDNTDTPVQVLVDGQWLPAAVAKFARTTPLTDPGTPPDGPGISELRALQARVADIAGECMPIPEHATRVEVTVDVARHTCSVVGSVEHCVGIEFFCDHHDDLIALIGGTAVVALAAPLIPALAAGLSSGASTLAAAWQRLGGLTTTVGAGSTLTTGGILIPAGAAITFTAQDLVLAGGALTIANIGIYLAEQVDHDGIPSEGSAGSPAPSPNFLEPTNPPQLPPKDLRPGHSVREMGPTEQYPDGYWIETNALGQPVNPSTGRPPSNVTRAEARAQTHVPMPPR